MDFELSLAFNFFRLFPSFLFLRLLGWIGRLGNWCSNESFTLVGIMKICMGVLKTIFSPDVPLGSKSLPEEYKDML